MSEKKEEPAGGTREPSGPRVLAAVRDAVLWLTLNRPEKRNAMDAPMVRALGAALERADLDAAVRVVALQGAGKDFCAGADLRELLDSVDRPAAENQQAAMELGRVFLAMRALPKLVVAVVHGRALAGGCGLATACDLIVAHEGAEFGYPEVRRGFVPAMAMTMLRRAVPEKVAFDLVATGRVLPAQAAREVGLVSRVFPAAGFEREVAAFLGELAGRSGTALALVKRQMYELDGRAFAAGIELGAQVNAVARATPDFRQAVREFLGE